MSAVRLDPNVNLRINKVVRRLPCPRCDVDAGKPCRVIGTNDEVGRQPGQYRTTSHLDRWDAADRDPESQAELDRVRVDGLRALWEQITGQVLTQANAERFRGHPDALKLGRMDQAIVRRAGIICWQASSTTLTERSLRLTQWAAAAFDLTSDAKADRVQAGQTGWAPADRKAALAAAYGQFEGTRKSAAGPKTRSARHKPATRRGCSERTKAGTPCTINPGVSGKCHVHDPALQCGHKTAKGRCAIPTGGGPCTTHRDSSDQPRRR
ncbi:hypothetical protein GCM10009662_43910 [Catellatospora coxensis]|uniref:DNA-binding phage zinc finger domain-containing protein n=1 Tax=Catellatospora coxensis TaxID=310354 RepID=A0A8J3KR58_9ACTN|nr:hypothetical protein Cco03nite_23750 [Catellatospora coxensis]